MQNVTKKYIGAHSRVAKLIQPSFQKKRPLFEVVPSFGGFLLFSVKLGEGSFFHLLLLCNNEWKNEPSLYDGEVNDMTYAFYM